MYRQTIAQQSPDELPSADIVRAQLAHIIDNGRPPVLYHDWPEMTANEILPEYLLHDVAIRDGRSRRHDFELHVHGFLFADHRTAVQDLTDKAERERVYRAEVEQIVKQYSGASEVVVFDHTIRIGDEQLQVSCGAQAPVKVVHNDFTVNSAPRRAREILGEAGAENRFKRRWGIIQVWRPIKDRVLADPLAICDGRTIKPEKFIRVQRRYRDHTAEIYHIAHDPEQEWHYFPLMTRDEILVFKTFDTDESVPTRFTAHSAFEDPNSPPGAAPRQSIETRSFAFW